MSLIHTLTILICLAALFSYVNHRLLGGVVDREPRPLWVLMQIKLFSLVRQFSARTISILTWGGLRGGISVALPLSLPAGQMREAVVVFSILVRGSRLTGYWHQARASRTGLKTSSKTGSSGMERLGRSVLPRVCPYVGLSLDRSFSETATLVRQDGGNPSQIRLAVGVRAWF